MNDKINELDFTVEEINMIDFMKKDSRIATINNIKAAEILFDREMKKISAGVLRKLEKLSDTEFKEFSLEAAE